ncbi:MAG TPA: NAD(P)-binding domain-containing protein [Acidimicrobiales bacterium]
MDKTSLLVVGAGPYGLAVAARARERGVDTVVVGHPLGFWLDHMPADMFLRSGIDWHLDAAGVHTFMAFVEEQGLHPNDLDPIPIAVFLDYATWFQGQKHLSIRDGFVSALERRDTQFVASLEDGSQIGAERVVAAPGCGYFAHVPEWAAELPDGLGSHTSDFVRFEEMAGQRVLIVGGRQSAYEWAALLGDHDVERVDIVHRHDVPRFERVSWRFVDDYVDATMRIPGWWRSLPVTDQAQIGRTFWEVGRMTLEWWLAPRLTGARFHVWPNTQVIGVNSEDAATVVTLSSGERLSVDRIIFATGYEAELANVPYLRPVISDIAVVDGFPALDENFQSSIPGLYFPGFAASRDFGPFFGFTKGCPAAATLIVDSLNDE